MSNVLYISTKSNCDSESQLDLELETKSNDDNHNENVDSVVFSIISQFVNRAKIGKTKYGTDLDRTDLSLFDWIQHAQEEHMDAILYLEKIKNEYKKESTNYKRKNDNTS